MDIGLVTDIKNQSIPFRIKDVVDGQRQLHDAQIGGQMAAVLGDALE